MRITRRILERSVQLGVCDAREVNKRLGLDFSTHEYRTPTNGPCTPQTASAPFSKLNYSSPSAVSPRLCSCSPFHFLRYFLVRGGGELLKTSNVENSKICISFRIGDYSDEKEWFIINKERFEDAEFIRNAKQYLELLGCGFL